MHNSECDSSRVCRTMRYPKHWEIDLEIDIFRSEYLFLEWSCYNTKKKNIDIYRFFLNELILNFQFSKIKYG